MDLVENLEINIIIIIIIILTVYSTRPFSAEDVGRSIAGGRTIISAGRRRRRRRRTEVWSGGVAKGSDGVL